MVSSAPSMSPNCRSHFKSDSSGSWTLPEILVEQLVRSRDRERGGEACRSADRRCLVEADRAVVAGSATPPLEIDGSAPHPRPAALTGILLRATRWNPVAEAPEGNGVCGSEHLLAAVGPVATRLVCGAGYTPCCSPSRDRVANRSWHASLPTGRRCARGEGESRTKRETRFWFYF